MEEWKEGGQNNIPLFRFPACSPRPRPGAPAGPSAPAPLPPSPAASLAERVEPGQAVVTLPARHSGLAKAGARVIALEMQGAWGRKGTGQRGLGGRPWSPGSEVSPGAGLSYPLTCRVAVAGLAGCPRVPAIEVLLAVLAVGPGRVVSAVEAAPAMACASEELPVKRALLRVAAAVASCGQEVGREVSAWPPSRVAVPPTPRSLVDPLSRSNCVNLVMRSLRRMENTSRPSFAH